MKTNGQIQYCPTSLIKHRRLFWIIKAEVTYDVWVVPFSGLFGSTSLFPLKEKKKMTSEMVNMEIVQMWHVKDLLIATHLHQLFSSQAQNAAVATIMLGHCWSIYKLGVLPYLTFLSTGTCTLAILGKETLKERLLRGQKDSSNSNFARDRRPWSHGKIFSRALQLCYWYVFQPTHTCSHAPLQERYIT